jgi:hypothetical protein
MKSLIFVLLIINQPFIVCAQNKADAERIMGRFMTLYNAGLYDSTYSLFSAEDRELISLERNTDGMRMTRDEGGKLTSYEYLGIDKDDRNPGLYVFITTWTKVGKKTSSFTLDKEGKFETFRLWTSSAGITKLLKDKKIKL